MSNKRALILGVTGQDGSFLADLLHEQGWEVHGMYRRVSTGNFLNISQAIAERRLILHRGDMTDSASLELAVLNSNPRWIFNMADQDNIDWSWAIPRQSIDVTAGGVGALLGVCGHKPVRIFQPISITMFSSGTVNENSILDPMSPYACAKAHAYHLCRMYRLCRGADVRCGILANHDSNRRHGEYLLHRICRSAVEGKEISVPPDTVAIDLGHARDYMRDAIKVMELENADDFVIGSGNVVYGSQLARMAQEVVSKSSGWQYAVEHHYRPGPIQQWVTDCSKLVRAIGERTLTPVIDLVAEVVEKYRRRA